MKSSPRTQSAPRGVRLYYATYRALSSLHVLTGAAFTGFWLGALKREHLYTIDQLYYSGTTLYIDDEYTRRGLWKWEETMLGRFFPKEGKLLLIGAGGGREMYALQKLGYEVDGYECHPSFVEYANDFLQREGLQSNVSKIKRDTCPPGEADYSGAIIGWGAYMLIEGREHRIAFLKNVRQRMLPDKPLLVSFFSRQEDSPGQRIIASVGSLVRKILRRPPLLLGDNLGPNYHHSFNEQDIADELRAAGFEPALYHASNEQPDDYGYAVAHAL